MGVLHSTHDKSVTGEKRQGKFKLQKQYFVLFTVLVYWAGLSETTKLAYKEVGKVIYINKLLRRERKLLFKPHAHTKWILK